MSDRSPSICRFWVLAAALVASTGGAASVGRTQQLNGSIGVSLTILQPIAGQAVHVTGFRVGDDGVARLETTMPSRARTSQLVMTRVSSSTTGFLEESQTPALVPAADAESRLRCLVHVGRRPRASDSPPVEVRVQYLTIAGT